MDADDVSLPGRFAAQARLLDAEPRVGAAGTRVEPFAEGGPVGEGLARYVAWQNTLVSIEDHARELFVESPLCHPSVMMRRAALDDAGGWRDVAWAEDYDLWLRMHAAGWGLAKVPEVLFRWRHHAHRATFRDARYAPPRFTDARAFYLAPRLANERRAVTVWGAGPTGKRLARALEAHGVAAARFVDIDPRKIGGVARGAPIVGESALARRDDFVVVAVGARGARQLIRARLAELGFVEGHDFVCAA
jgi:hypothetical protein